MSCTCYSPIRPEFKDSYNDLLDKPKINGVTLSGNLTAADLGIKAGAQFKIVPQLPVTDIDEATIYLVPVQVGQTDNIYQEWIYINNKWEKIGEPISIEGGGGIGSINRISVTLDSAASWTTRRSLEAYLEIPLENNKTYAVYGQSGAMAGIFVQLAPGSSSAGFEYYNGLDHVPASPDNPGDFVFLEDFRDTVAWFNGMLYIVNDIPIFDGSWTTSN
jgi:hypothetical protein